jgi:hypothetical protein
MTDLHARLKAELDRRLAVAGAAEADAPSPWRYGIASPRYDAIMDRTRSWTFTFAHHYEPSTFVVAHVELHDPADAIRRYTGELEVLERHMPTDRDKWRYGIVCSGCPNDAVTYPCNETRDLAFRLGVSLTDQDS